MKKIYLLLLLFIVKLKLCINYTVESIKETIPVTGTLFFYKSSYKIYEYIPPCEQDENLNKTKNIIVKIDNSNYLNLYIYDNISKIEQNEEGEFINYTYKNEIEMEHRKYNNFICQKDYYLILAHDSLRSSSEFINYHFSIFDEINDIYLNPS